LNFRNAAFIPAKSPAVGRRTCETSGDATDEGVARLAAVNTVNTIATDTTTAMNDLFIRKAM
jgi:hypothetical protein